MLPKKRVTLPKLLSYILSLATDTTNDDNMLESVFTHKTQSNDEFKFNCLKYGESKNINDFPEKLKNIFDPYIKDFIRYGSRITFGDDHNLSLYYSIFACSIKNFRTLSSTEQSTFINKLREKIIIFLTNDDVFKSLEYDKMGWIKKDIINSFVQYKTNKLVLKVIADYLNINIFVLNITEDRIYIVSENTSYDMFRPNIFLSFNNDTFEQLSYLDNMVLDYLSPPIKKLVTVDKNFLLIMNTNITNDVQINFNLKLSTLDKYIKKEIKSNIADHKECSDNDTIENEYGEVIVEDSEEPDQKLTFNISSKMKKDELQQIAKKLNIDIEKNGTKKKIPKTNNELIIEINAKLVKV